MSRLPNTWVQTTMAEIADVKLGKMLDAIKNKGVPVPYLRNVNVRWGSFELSDILEMRMTATEQETFSIKNGDVLICEGGEPGRAAVWRSGPTNLKYQKALHRARAYEGISPDLLAFFLKYVSASGEIERRFTGTTIKHLPLAAIKELEFPLPPVSEQRRMAAKIDSLFAKSRRASDHLDHIARLVKKYQEAILAAAVDGKLTSEWRKVNDGGGLPSETLHEVRAQRQHDRRLSRRKAANVVPDAVLPERWLWISPDELADNSAYSVGIGPFGSNLLRSDYRERGVRLIFVRDISTRTF